MAHFAPFTAHLRVLPFRGKRFEYIRSLQRLARRVYTALDSNPDLNLAKPGGGQSSQLFNFMNSDYVDGMAIKPQFGETPAQLAITGFFNADGPNTQPHPDKQLIHTGAFVSGAGGAHPYRAAGNPTPAVVSQIKSLKADIEAEIAAELPGEPIVVFRIDYKGITWGDRGFFWPI